MAICLPCFVIPFFLFIWRFIQPWILMFWNPDKNLPQSENKTITDNSESKCPIKSASTSEEVKEEDKKEQ